MSNDKKTAGAPTGECSPKIQPAEGREMTLNRRKFLEAATAASLLTTLPAIGAGEDRAEEIPRRALGSTGERVSCIGIGGYHIGKQGLEESEASESFARPWTKA